MKKIQLTKRMKEVAEFFGDLPQTYFVGGCIRDLILKVEPHDYDLITVAHPDAIMAYIKSKGRKVYKTGLRYGTLSCKVGDSKELVEITTFRSEIYDFKSRKPVVKFTKNLDEDLGRRDFTINALACDFDGNIKGNSEQAMSDISNKILRAVGDSKIRFREDPLRILRGIRFAAKYSLVPEKKTAERLNHVRWDILRLSKERVISELNKILQLPVPQLRKALKMLWICEIWQVVLPYMQLQYEYDQFNPHHDFTLDEHTIRIVCNVRAKTDNLKLLWCALLHDIAKVLCAVEHKDGTRNNYINHELLGSVLVTDFLIKYKFSNVYKDFIVKTVKDHVLDTCWLKKFDNMSKLK